MSDAESMKIPVAAKNAAFLVLASRYPNSDLVYSEEFIRAMDEALAAAAPHMLAGPHPTRSSFVTPANNAHIAMCPHCQVTFG